VLGVLEALRERIDGLLSRYGIDHEIVEYGAFKQLNPTREVTVVIRARDERVSPAGIGFKLFEREGTVELVVYVQRTMPGATNASLEECSDRLDYIIALIMNDFSRNAVIGKYVISYIDRVAPNYSEFGYCVEVLEISLKRYDAIQ